MSLKTWKREYYPIAAAALADADDVTLVEHVLRKWRGALPDALRKHGLVWGFHGVGDTYTWQGIGFHYTNCALCLAYPGVPNVYSEDVIRCPLYRYLGKSCDEVDKDSQDDPRPMIEALEGTLRMLRKEGT